MTTLGPVETGHLAAIWNAWVDSTRDRKYADLGTNGRRIRDEAHRSLSYFGQHITSHLGQLGLTDPAAAAPFLTWVADDAMWMVPDPPLSIGGADIRDLINNLAWKATRYAADGKMTQHDVMVEAVADVALFTHQPAPGPCDCATLYADKHR